jgi:hypothetical protein
LGVFLQLEVLIGDEKIYQGLVIPDSDILHETDLDAARIFHRGIDLQIAQKIKGNRHYLTSAPELEVVDEKKGDHEHNKGQDGHETHLELEIPLMATAVGWHFFTFLLLTF